MLVKNNKPEFIQRVPTHAKADCHICVLVLIL